MDRMRTFSVLPGMPGRRQEMLRITISTRTPARLASEILSMTSRSVSELSLKKTRAGSPARARSISRLRPVMIRGLRPAGADAQVAVVAVEVAQRKVLEEQVGVLANAGVRGHEHEIRVQLRGLLVEVAGAEQRDALDAPCRVYT